MSKYHVNPATGQPGVCKAVKKCKFGAVEHYDSDQAARQAYEEKQSAMDAMLGLKKEPYADFKHGKAMSEANLNSLPTGAVVRWPLTVDGVKDYALYYKQETGSWIAVERPGRQFYSPQLGGADGYEQATFVSVSHEEVEEK